MGGIVITGGPGTGKTTLIEKMTGQEYTLVPEAARIALSTGKRRQKILSRNQIALAAKIHDIQLQQHKSVTNKHLLDRSPVDPIAYVEADGKKPTRKMLRTAKEYRPEMVFLLAPLKTYKNDAIRTEDEKTAQKIHEQIRQVYTRLGHRIIEVPDLGSVEKRADFVKRKIKEFRLANEARLNSV